MVKCKGWFKSCGISINTTFELNICGDWLKKKKDLSQLLNSKSCDRGVKNQSYKLING